MKASEQLRAEHQGIRMMMSVLGKICDNMASGGRADTAQIAKILDFFKVFVDKCHHGKEEAMLFPALEKVGIAKEGGPIGVMLSEHEHGRALVRNMTKFLAEYESGSSDAGKEFCRNTREYIGFLDSHIDKENNVLFEMADANLSEAEQNDLYERFEKFEEEKIGSGVHEEFHKFMDALAAQYLK
jgi:hemerythrin-like domain-containing protein